MRLLNVLLLLSYLLVLNWAQGMTENMHDLNQDKYEAEEVIGKSPSQILKLRGFRSEIHFVKTKDGYYINVVRIINPRLPSGAFKRPVIFNHGLLESATIWLINSRNVYPQHVDPCAPIPEDPMAFNGTFYLNASMMLAAFGYDVWLLSMRGTDYSLRHTHLKPSNPAFWNYSLDNFSFGDVPATINYVRRRTGHEKVGYVGHSQACFAVFALLTEQPNYSDHLEPIVAIAPVSYINHLTSFGAAIAVSVLELTGSKQTHFPKNARVSRDGGKRCDRPVYKQICELTELLLAGAGKRWKKGYFAHLPFYTSLKVLRHFGQLIESKRFAHYDEGKEANLRIYGAPEPPSFDIKKIRSTSIVIVSSRSDSLSTQPDVDRFISELSVPLQKHIFIEKELNHLDLILSDEVRALINRPLLEIFELFEKSNQRCSSNLPFNATEELERDIMNDQMGGNCTIAEVDGKQETC